MRARYIVTRVEVWECRHGRTDTESHNFSPFLRHEAGFSVNQQKSRLKPPQNHGPPTRVFTYSTWSELLSGLLMIIDSCMILLLSQNNWETPVQVRRTFKSPGKKKKKSQTFAALSILKRLCCFSWFYVTKQFWTIGRCYNGHFYSLKKKEEIFAILQIIILKLLVPLACLCVGAEARRLLAQLS